MSGVSDTVTQVVAALIYREGRLLVCQRRKHGAFPLKWEFPGGKVEEGESDIDALARELREELAIEMRRAALIWQHTHRYAGGLIVELRFYSAFDVDGEPKNLVFENISWVDLSKLAHMDFLDGDRPLIQKLVSEGETILLPSNC